METTKSVIVSIDHLALDSFNPRLPTSLHGKNEIEIINYLLLTSSLIELMQAIAENDFFAGEQLLVVEIDKDNFKVVEGNRRLASVKLLCDRVKPDIHKRKIETVLKNAIYKPSEIPCLVFEHEKDILKYLGYRHVTGIKSWKSLEKARYLENLRVQIFKEQSDLSFIQMCKNLAKIIGSRSDYVKRILIGMRIFSFIEDNNFFNIEGLNDTTFYYVNLADSLNRSNIAEYFGVTDSEILPEIESLNLENIENWTKWLFEKNSELVTRVNGTSSQLKKLNDIIGNEIALAAFIEGKSLEDAALISGNVDNIFFESLQKSIIFIKQADSVSHKVDKYYTNLDNDLKEIVDLCRKIRATKIEKEDADDFKY